MSLPTGRTHRVETGIKWTAGSAAPSRAARFIEACVPVDMSDRAPSPSFRVTQEFLANMLGVRRAGVTQAAGRLQARGLIRYQRGNIMIRDREALERASCSCYAINAATCRRVLG